MGLRTDTHLVGQDFSNLAMWFYVGFVVCEFPTQFLAQHFSRLGLYLGVNVALWGIVLAGHAACTSYAQLAVLRTLLGVFESCVAPILVIMIAMWYKKSEQGKRISYFYVCNSLTQIFGGLVAYGVSFTHGTFAPWRIFLLVIGLLTIIVGIAVALLLPDSPVKARRLTDAEKVAVLLRVKENQRWVYPMRILPSQGLTHFHVVARKMRHSRGRRSSRPSRTFVSGSLPSAPC